MNAPRSFDMRGRYIQRLRDKLNARARRKALTLQALKLFALFVLLPLAVGFTAEALLP